MSDERTAHLDNNEKWIMRIAVGFSALAIASFTWTKWEVEARLKEELNEEERKAWFAGGNEAAQQKRREMQVAHEARHPHPAHAPPLPPINIQGFVPAETFTGPREGMVFKSDLAGLGYYVDQPLALRNAPSSECPE